MPNIMYYTRPVLYEILSKFDFCVTLRMFKITSYEDKSSGLKGFIRPNAALPVMDEDAINVASTDRRKPRVYTRITKNDICVQINMYENACKIIIYDRVRARRYYFRSDKCATFKCPKYVAELIIGKYVNFLYTCQPLTIERLALLVTEACNQPVLAEHKIREYTQSLKTCREVLDLCSNNERELVIGTIKMINTKIDELRKCEQDQ